MVEVEVEEAPGQSAVYRRDLREDEVHQKQ
jgi:hypothetical protein